MFRRKAIPRVEVQAVDDRGLEKLLRELCVFETLGVNARCSSCGDIVTFQTISAVYPEDGEVRFLCSNAKCTSRDGGLDA